MPNKNMERAKRLERALVNEARTQGLMVLESAPIGFSLGTIPVGAIITVIEEEV